MSSTSGPPFRAEHIGSLLRPPELLHARGQHAAGALDRQALAAIEEQAIREVVKLWGDCLKDRRFEMEGEWKNKLAGGTRGTVEALTRELREALRG